MWASHVPVSNSSTRPLNLSVQRNLRVLFPKLLAGLNVNSEINCISFSYPCDLYCGT
jgi:hypothetical protein